LIICGSRWAEPSQPRPRRNAYVRCPSWSQIPNARGRAFS
jgi:hypothetical protein